MLGRDEPGAAYARILAAANNHCTFGLTGDEGGRVGIAARPTRSEHHDSAGQHGSHWSGGADPVGKGAVAAQGAPLPSPCGHSPAYPAVQGADEALAHARCAALEVIAYPGKMGASGKRTRFRLSTPQQRITSYLAEIGAALGAAGRARDDGPALRCTRLGPLPIFHQSPAML